MCFHVGRDHLDGICGYICGSNLPSKCKHQATQYVLTACSLFFQATKHMFCHPVMFWRMAFHKNTAWQHMDLETFCGAQNNIPKQRSFTSVLLAQTQCLGNTAMLNPWKHFSFKDGLGNFCLLAAASVSSPAKGDWGGSHGHSNEWGNSASWTWWRSYGFLQGQRYPAKGMAWSLLWTQGFQVSWKALSLLYLAVPSLCNLGKGAAEEGLPYNCGGEGTTRRTTKPLGSRPDLHGKVASV